MQLCIKYPQRAPLSVSPQKLPRAVLLLGHWASGMRCFWPSNSWFKLARVLLPSYVLVLFARGFAHLCLTDLSLTDAYKRKRVKKAEKTATNKTHYNTFQQFTGIITTQSRDRLRDSSAKPFQTTILSQIWPCWLNWLLYSFICFILWAKSWLHPFELHKQQQA